jgi:hypothetical protein
MTQTPTTKGSMRPSSAPQAFATRTIPDVSRRGRGLPGQWANGSIYAIGGRTPPRVSTSEQSRHPHDTDSNLFLLRRLRTGPALPNARASRASCMTARSGAHGIEMEIEALLRRGAQAERGALLSGCHIRRCFGRG